MSFSLFVSLLQRATSQSAPNPSSQPIFSIVEFLRGRLEPIVMRGITTSLNHQLAMMCSITAGSQGYWDLEKTVKKYYLVAERPHNQLDRCAYFRVKFTRYPASWIRSLQPPLRAYPPLPLHCIVSCVQDPFWFLPYYTILS